MHVSKKKMIQNLQALRKAVMKANLSGFPFLISAESFAVGYHFALLFGSLSVEDHLLYCTHRIPYSSLNTLKYVL